VYNKKVIRKKILNNLKKLTKTARYRKSLNIRKELFNLKEFKSADVVMTFIGRHDEVDTVPIIKRALKLDKTIVVPVTKLRENKLILSKIKNPEKELALGPFGIKQPKGHLIRKTDIKSIDLFLVPGVAFDRSGNRLGRGRGCYDRLLECVDKKKPRIGLCFDFQIVDSIPTLSHDVPVTKIVCA